MNLSDEAIRKAAILVAALDTAAADALLESMDDDVAARVRASCMELDEVDAHEQQRVIEQFLSGNAQEQGSPPATSSSPTIDELDLSSAVPLATYLSNSPVATTQADNTIQSTTARDDPPFGFLESATGEQLAAALRYEHPQTIAVVLANVAPATAAAALARLAASQQAEVARRIMDLRQVDGDALDELRASLRELLNSRLGHNPVEQSGFEAMQRIWREASASEKLALERNLRERDAQLLRDLGDFGATDQAPVTTSIAGVRLDHLRPTAIEFEQLAQLESAFLRRVLQRVPGRLLLLALAGASETFIERVYSHLPRPEARLLRRQIEQQGPIALRDVAEAQRRIALLAGHLAAQGEINIPNARRVAATA